MAEKDHKKTTRSFFRRTIFIGLIVVLLLNSYLIWSMQRVVTRIDKYNQGVVDEIGSIKGDVKPFANDLNEIRRFLLLPEVDYSVLENEGNKNVESTQETNKDSIAIFAMLDEFSKEKKYEQRNQQAQQSLQNLLLNNDFIKGLSETSLQPGERDNFHVKFNDVSGSELNGQPIFNLAFDIESDVFLIQSALGEQQVKNHQTDQFGIEVLNYLKKNTTQAINKKISEKKNAEKESQQTEANAQKEVEKRKANLESLLKDPAFLDTIKKEGWKLSETAKEESNKFYYDILDSTNNTIVFSIGVELSSGMIKVIRNGQEINIRNFLEDQGSKKKL